MKRLLIVLLVALWAAVANAATFSTRCQINIACDWTNGAAWSISGCGGTNAAATPTAIDDVVICTGHYMRFDKAADEVADARNITIQSGAWLTSGVATTTMSVDGTAAGTQNAILNSGTLIWGNGGTIMVTPDVADNCQSEVDPASMTGCDGIGTLSGGRTYLVGTLLGGGSVGTVVSDDGKSDIVFLANGTVPKTGDWNNKVLAFQSGRQKGVRYDITAQTLAGKLTLKFDSHQNQEGLAPYSIPATCTLTSSTQVDCASADFTGGVNAAQNGDPGNYWKFNADTESDCSAGPSSTSCCWTEIKRRVSATQIILKNAYPGAPCSAVATVAAAAIARTGSTEAASHAENASNQVIGASPYQDRPQLILPAGTTPRTGFNLYYNAMDIHIQSGDKFIVYDPVHVTIKTASKNNTNNMPVLRTLDGGSLYARYAELDWIHEGFSCYGIDNANANEHFEVLDSEIHNFNGHGAIHVKGGCHNYTVARNYIHDIITDIETTGASGDGCTVTSGFFCAALYDASYIADPSNNAINGVHFVDNHVARVYEGAHLYTGFTNGEISGNIIHHGAKLSGGTENFGLMFFDSLAAAPAHRTVNITNFRIERNWFYNIMRGAIRLSDDPGSKSDWGGAPFEFLIRDNVFMNVEEAAIGSQLSGTANMQAWPAQTFAVINNYASSVEGKCFGGLPGLFYHNTCANSTVVESSSSSAPGPQIFQGNILVNWQGPIDPVVGGPIEAISQKNSVVNYVRQIKFTDNVIWGMFQQGYVVQSDFANTIGQSISHNTFFKPSRGLDNLRTYGVPVLTVKDNLFMNATGLAQFGAMRVVIGDAVSIVESNNAFSGMPQKAINFTLSGTSLDVADAPQGASLRNGWVWSKPSSPGLAAFVTSDGTPVGARVAGTICSRLPIDVDCYPFLNTTGNTDTDGDGIFDLFDNCASRANPFQQDANGNGIGDACGS